MNVVKCKKGHFFDGDTYSMCPHCGEGIGDGSSQGSKDKPAPIKWPGGRGGKKPPKTPSVQPIPYKWTESTDSENVSIDESPQNEPEISPASDGKTLPLWDYHKQKDDDSAIDVAHKDTPKQSPSPNSLAEAVKEAAGDRDGKTVSYFGGMTESSSGRAAAPKEPVVGWLVCIKGKHFGESFCISSGKNSIGRGDGNRIVIADDESISREKHALIIYEHKMRNFYIQPGDSSGLTYLNDEYISEQKKLNARDVIELGASKFIFIPLCNESFSWEDYV